MELNEEPSQLGKRLQPFLDRLGIPVFEVVTFVTKTNDLHHLRDLPLRVRLRSLL